MGGPHGGGEPHGTPLRLGTPCRHGRRAPRGAPLHGGRQRQIRGSVPSHGARVLEVRIHLPPAESHTNHRFLARDRGMSVPRRERRESVSGTGTGQGSLSRVAQNALDLCNSDPISLGHLGDRHTVLIHARMRASCERGISPADGEGVLAVSDLSGKTGTGGEIVGSTRCLRGVLAVGPTSETDGVPLCGFANNASAA